MPRRKTTNRAKPIEWVVEKVLDEAERDRRDVGDKSLKLFHIVRGIVRLERSPLRLIRKIDNEQVVAITPYVREGEIKEILYQKGLYDSKLGIAGLSKIVRTGADLLHKLENPYRILTEPEIEELIEVHIGKSGLNYREKQYLIKILTGKRLVSDPNWVANDLKIEELHRPVGILDVEERQRTLKEVIELLRIKKVLEGKLAKSKKLSKMSKEEIIENLEKTIELMNAGKLDQWITNKRLLTHTKHELKQLYNKIKELEEKGIKWW